MVSCFGTISKSINASTFPQESRPDVPTLTELEGRHNASSPRLYLDASTIQLQAARYPYTFLRGFLGAFRRSWGAGRAAELTSYRVPDMGSIHIGQLGDLLHICLAKLYRAR